MVRIKARNRIQRALYGHVQGLTRPIYARDVDDAVVVLVDAWDDALDAVGLAEMRRRGKKGRPPKHVVDILLAGPPGYATSQEWDPEKEVAWARSAVEWCKDLLGPESVVFAAALHRDEAAPHVHLLAVPIQDGRLGWCRRRDAAVKQMQVRTGTEQRTVGYPVKYGHFQDDFQMQVGRHFGLARGKSGVPVEHQRIDGKRGLQRSIEILQHDVAVLTEHFEAEERKGRLALQERLERQERDLEEKIELRRRLAEDVGNMRGLGRYTRSGKRGAQYIFSLQRDAQETQRKLEKAEAEKAEAEAEKAEAEAEKAEAEAEMRRVEEAKARQQEEAERKAAELEEELGRSEDERRRMKQREGEVWKSGRASMQGDITRTQAQLDAAHRQIDVLESERQEDREKAGAMAVTAFVHAFSTLLRRNELMPAIQSVPEVFTALRLGYQGRFVPGKAAGTERPVDLRRDVL